MTRRTTRTPYCAIRQLVQQLIQLQQTYRQTVNQYNLGLRMPQNLQNMPARYRAQFSQWRNVVAPNTYGNTGMWVNGMNTGLLGSVNTGYQQSTTPLLQYNGQFLAGMTPDEQNRVKSQYTSVELSDGSNVTTMATIGAIRESAQMFQNQINNLEQGSLSGDPNLNTEVSVLNKINATNILTGCGKTTLLSALGKFITDDDRILLIEDTSNIQLEKPNLVRFEARQAGATQLPYHYDPHDMAQEVACARRLDSLLARPCRQNRHGRLQQVERGRDVSQEGRGASGNRL